MINTEYRIVVAVAGKQGRIGEHMDNVNYCCGSSSWVVMGSLDVYITKKK